MEKARIRLAREKDLKAVVNLCKQHAEYEKVEYRSSNQVEKLAKAIFTKDPMLFCLIAEVDRNTVGFATFMKQFSTWEADFYLYVDCLFIKPEFRSRLIGERLMARIKDEAEKAKIGLIQWQTPNFNKRAIKFYRRIGAVSKSKERFFLEI